MFRRGGSTGEGITSGLRQGYENGETVQPNFEQETLRKIANTKIELPKSTASADFWLNLGTSILAQPGGRPILQTLGTAGKEPLARFQQQRAAEGQLKYQHAMGNRAFLLEAWKALSDEDKTAMQKNIAWLQTEEGGGLTQAEALDRVAGEFRKKMHPEEKKYKEEQKEEDFQRDQIDKIQDDFQQMDPDISLTYNQGKKILDFKNLADEQGHPYTMDETVFIDRGTWKSEGGFGGATDDDGNITLTTDNVDLFVEGFAYVDLTTGHGYYRQGPKLIKIVVDEDIISAN
tara:strand:- start:342 stop:1208 length:867 start_codon:yes stop_codon:yes gene_type:complete